MNAPFPFLGRTLALVLTLRALLLFCLEDAIRSAAPAGSMSIELFRLHATERMCIAGHRYTSFDLNSSGTSTDGFPSAFNFASNFGFSNICVRDGREMYGRLPLHSYVKCPVVQRCGVRATLRFAAVWHQLNAPVPRHFWHTVLAVARGWLADRRCGAYLDMVRYSAQRAARVAGTQKRV